MQQSLDTIVSRHEVLRTSFPRRPRKPTLSISTSATMKMPLLERQPPAGSRTEEKGERIGWAGDNRYSI